MTGENSDRRVLNALLATNLLAFLERAFRDLDPRNRLLVVPFVELLVQELHDVATGATRRLIINLPPRHLKSVLVSIVFPAWLLGRDPRLRIAVISHGQSLARDLAHRTLLLVQAEWYRDVFPAMRLRASRSGTVDFETTEGGGRYAASLDTGVTGRGFDLIIVDDPLSAQDARSAAERQRNKESYDGMIASRLDDPVRGALIIVHQRLHEDDLTGYLLPKGDWRHVSLPLVAEEETAYRIGSRIWARRVDEALMPELYPPDEIKKLRAERGAAIFAAQYQQDPTASIGELLHPDHIRYFDDLPAEARRVTISVDTATKTTAGASYTVFLVIASDNRRHYIVDVLRQRLDPVQARDAAVRLIHHYRPTKILIEDASSGPGLAQMLLERGYRSELWPTRGRGKEERFEAHLHFFVDGRILVKRNQSWTIALVNEWLRFPFARHDDQVDAMSQYLERVSDHPLVNPIVVAVDGSEARAVRALFGPPPRKGEHPMRPRGRGPGPTRPFRPR
jgi:predicted phage terminase large subunit-like protein